MRIRSEDELLDPAVRKLIIEEIKGAENQTRKRESYRKYLMYRDRTDEFVREKLLKQFDMATVQEMDYCVSNVSLVRKVIDKLAKVYNYGVTRKLKDDAQNVNLQHLEKVLKVNSNLKKANKFLKLQKNVLLYVKPCQVATDGVEKWKLKLEVLNPYLYDAIEDYYDRTEAMAYVLSDFTYQQASYTTQDAATVNRNGTSAGMKPGDGKDQIIADRPEDQNSKEYIFWSNKYHFTCDEQGEIISGGDNLNPIQKKPFAHFAIDQDGSFWASGGNDLTDAGILVNAMITNVLHVGIVQGYGQFWMSGQNLPRAIKMGPTKAILMEHTKDEAEGKLGYASANPQIAELRSLVEMYVALILTTNNLSTSGVATNLSGGTAFPSGIAMFIDKSESMEDVQDQAQIFKDMEPVIWDLIACWLDAYKNFLVDDLKGRLIPKNPEIETVFGMPEQLMSEGEKIEAIKKRQEAGLNTQIELIMKDRGCTEAEAKDVLKRILEEKMEAKARAIASVDTADGVDDEGEENRSGAKPSDIDDRTAGVGPDQGSRGKDSDQE